MERSLGWMCVALLTVLSGCGEPEAPRSEPSTPALAARHDAVTLATTTPTTPTITAPPAPRVPAPVVPRRTEHSSELTLRRLVVATDMQDHEPVGATDVVGSDAERVYAFLDVENPADAQTLIVTFASDDGERVVGHVEVTVPAHAPRWRTWAFSRHLSPGGWQAEVHTVDGRLVDSHAFDVE